jgi:hypothetical protein
MTANTAFFSLDTRGIHKHVIIRISLLIRTFTSYTCYSMTSRVSDKLPRRQVLGQWIQGCLDPNPEWGGDPRPNGGVQRRGGRCDGVSHQSQEDSEWCRRGGHGRQWMIVVQIRVRVRGNTWWRSHICFSSSSSKTNPL